jgi:hypothetical protein
MGVSLLGKIEIGFQIASIYGTRLKVSGPAYDRLFSLAPQFVAARYGQAA